MNSSFFKESRMLKKFPGGNSSKNEFLPNCAIKFYQVFCSQPIELNVGANWSFEVYSNRDFIKINRIFRSHQPITTIGLIEFAKKKSSPDHHQFCE